MTVSSDTVGLTGAAYAVRSAAVLIRDPDSGVCEPALQEGSNRLRLDLLFSWQPTPGTVFFAGYGSTLDEAEPLRFSGLSRLDDGFFVKFSYLFRQ